MPSSSFRLQAVIPDQPTLEALNAFAETLLGQDPVPALTPEEFFDVMNGCGGWGPGTEWDMPRCYAAALAARMLAEVRRHRLVDPRVGQIAQLWAPLEFASRKDFQWTQVDAYSRWLPIEPSTSEGDGSASVLDAKALVETIQQRCGPSFIMPFPVVCGSKNWILPCRVTKLIPQPSVPGGVDPCLPASALVLAPWSTFLVMPSTLKSLQAEMQKLHGAGAKFLLEVLPPTVAPEDHVPGSALVAGNSLDLAVVLAALATAALGAPGAAALLPIVATGRLSGGKAGAVGGIREKAKAVWHYAKAQGERVVFVVPPGTPGSLYRPVIPAGSLWVEVIEADQDPAILLALLKKQFSDGCDELRRCLRGVSPHFRLDPLDAEDSDELAIFKGSLLGKAVSSSLPDLPTFLLGFGVEPSGLVKHLAASVVEQCIPLPLCLDLPDSPVPPDAETEAGAAEAVEGLLPEPLPAVDPVGLLAASVSLGLGRLFPRDDEPPLVLPETLRTLIRFHSTRLLFLLFDKIAVEREVNKAHGERVRQIRMALQSEASAASAVLVASDIHHLHELAAQGLVASNNPRLKHNPRPMLGRS